MTAAKVLFRAAMMTKMLNDDQILDLYKLILLVSELAPDEVSRFQDEAKQIIQEYITAR